jgi:tripartite-type tricarboxylate transporter receptor subunit TctC
MKLFRKTLAFAVTGLIVLPALPAFGQDAVRDYPVKPVRWIVTFPPGASNDIVARLMAGKLSEILGQQFVVDNRGGAGGLIGAEIVSVAQPDGHTLVLANPAPMINSPLMAQKAPYSLGDFAPVVYFGFTPLIVAAHPSFSAKTPKELLETLKANPGKYSWGSSGNGSSLHIGLALFQRATGLNVVHVPYKGTAPALADLVGGQIQLMYTTKVSSDGQVRAGRIRILGVASAKRSAALPDVPTLAEFGIKDAEAVTWFGMAAPARTPRPIIDRLNEASHRILAMPDVRKRLEENDVEIQGGTPEDFGRFMKREAERLVQLMKAGIIGKL